MQRGRSGQCGRLIPSKKQLAARAKSMDQAKVAKKKKKAAVGMKTANLKVRVKSSGTVKVTAGATSLVWSRAGFK
jgi:hypothetical protein